MKPKALEYFDWADDIRPEICRLIGIDQSYFAKYHEIVGGEYKNLWHAYLWFIDQRCSDGGTYPLYSDASQIGDTYAAMIRFGTLPDKYIGWTKPLFDAIDAIHIKYGEDLYIQYNW